MDRSDKRVDSAVEEATEGCPWLMLPDQVRSEVERFLRADEESSRPYMRSLGLSGISFVDVMKRIREVCL